MNTWLLEQTPTTTYAYYSTQIKTTGGKEFNCTFPAGVCVCVCCRLPIGHGLFHLSDMRCPGGSLA